MSTHSFRYLSYIWLVTSFPITAEAAKKFQRWFPKSEGYFADLSKNTCNVTLKAYEDAYNHYHGAAWIDLGLRRGQIFDLCYAHESCMIENLSGYLQATLQSSAVILGVLPTLLAVLSPSIPEVALLSSHRPFLSVLLSLGSPGVLQTRIFEYLDPAELLGPIDADVKSSKIQLTVGPWPWVSSAIWSAIEYCVVLTSIANMLYLAIELGERAILTWGCTKTWPPILWMLSPVIIHGFAAVGYHLVLETSSRRRKLSVSAGSESKLATKASPDIGKGMSTETSALEDPSSRADSKDTRESNPFLHRLRKSLLREFTPCATHAPIVTLRLPRPHRDLRMTVGVFLHCFAGFLSFIHLLFGTVTLSGLSFIHSLDALGDIAMRFLISSLACRFVVLVEIAGMRGARIKSARRER